MDEKIHKRILVGDDENQVEIKEESGNSSSEEESEDEESDELESDNSISASTNNGNKKKLGKKQSKSNKKIAQDDDDILLSDDELQEDKVVAKGKSAKGNKKGKKSVEDEEDVKEEIRLEDDPDYVFETNMSFQQMNLSRPLLKVKFNYFSRNIYFLTLFSIICFTLNCRQLHHLVLFIQHLFKLLLFLLPLVGGTYVDVLPPGLEKRLHICCLY